MNNHTVRGACEGPAGALEWALDLPDPILHPRPLGLLLACHPHPLHGGTMDNKVVHTIARAALATGWRCVRFNFRGVGASEGVWDQGVGEIEDALAVLRIQCADREPLVVAGFSFGAYVASHVAVHAHHSGAAVIGAQLIAPATENFSVAPPLETIPTLVIHGDADEVVPLSSTLAWARATGQPVCVFPGVGHFFHGQLPRLRTVLEQSLRSLST